MNTKVDLEACLVQVEASKAWFHHRVLPLSIEQLRWRPDARQWSIAECLDHLNLTLALYLPKIDDAIRRGRAATPCAGCEQAELDALQAFEPPVTTAEAAPRATMPGAGVDADWLVEQFHLTRDHYRDALRQASGLDLPHIRIAEPIYPVIVSLGGTLAFIAAHDRRHMWQAERVRQAPRFPRVVF